MSTHYEPRRTTRGMPADSSTVTQMLNIGEYTNASGGLTVQLPRTIRPELPIVDFRVVGKEQVGFIVKVSPQKLQMLVARANGTVAVHGEWEMLKKRRDWRGRAVSHDTTRLMRRVTSPLMRAESHVGSVTGPSSEDRRLHRLRPRHLSCELSPPDALLCPVLTSTHGEADAPGSAN